MIVRSRASSAGTTTASAAVAGCTRSRRCLDAFLCADGSGAPSFVRGRTAGIPVVLGILALLSILMLSLAAGASAAEEEGTPQLVNIGELGKVNPNDAEVMADGEWRYINGIDVNWKTGNVYALDPNMSRVQVFNSNGVFLFSFGEEGTGGGQFGKYSSQGLTIDQETGDVYVGEAGGPFANHRVSKFNESGKFILTFGKEVDATTEADICTAASGDECRPGTTHEQKQLDGEIDHAAAPIVNQTTHAVLVPMPGVERLAEFSSGGTFIESFPVPGIGEFVFAGPEYLYGRSISSGPGGGAIVKWTSTGTPAGFFSPGFKAGEYGVWQMALAPGTDTPSETRLFASQYNVHDESWSVGEWTLAGELLQEHAPGLSQGGFVGVDPVNHKIYIANGYPDGRVLVLGKPTTLPKATIEPATNVTPHTATVNGQVNPEGSAYPTGWHFEYRRQGEKAWLNAPVRNGIQELKISGEPTGGTFKLSWARDGWSAPEATAALPYNATPAEVKSALLDLDYLEPGDVSVRGEAGDWIVLFEGRYIGAAEPDLPSITVTENNLTGGTNPEVSQHTLQNINVGNGTSDVPASLGLGTLDPSTTYEVRLAVRRSEGAGSGISEIGTFTTAPLKPEFSLIAATHISDTQATLQADVNAEHAPTSYCFEYGTDTSYGMTAPAGGEGDAGEKMGPVGVFEHLEGLLPDTTYHFKLIAENAGGNSESADYTFHTYSTAEQEWAKRDIELVNNPDKGNQNSFPGIYWERPLSLDGSEVLWRTFSGAPGSPSGFSAMYLATRDPGTGWHSQPIGPPSAEEMIGGGDLFYRPAAVSRDFRHYVMVAEAGFFDENHPHVWLKLNLDGSQELIQDTGAENLSNVLISDDGSHCIYETPHEGLPAGEIIDFHDGVKDPLPTPSCGNEEFHPAYQSLSRIFVQSDGNDPACDEPGIYMIDTVAQTVTEIAPEGQFMKTTRDGYTVIFSKAHNFYKWTEGGGIECLTCGKLPAGVEPGGGTVSDDLSHIYFTIGAGGNPLHPDPNRGLYEINGSSVKRIALAGSAEEMTADEGTIVFSSYENRVNSADLTGWNEKPELTGESDQYEHLQVYRYSDRDGFVECVSCYGGPPGRAAASQGCSGTPIDSRTTVARSPSSPTRNSTKKTSTPGSTSTSGTTAPPGLLPTANPGSPRSAQTSRTCGGSPATAAPSSLARAACRSRATRSTT